MVDSPAEGAAEAEGAAGSIICILKATVFISLNYLNASNRGKDKLRMPIIKSYINSVTK